MIRPVLHVLYGALFTVAAAWSVGALLLRWLDVPLCRMERALFAFATGSGCLSLLVFALASAHLARKGVFLAFGAAAILAAGFLGLFRARGAALPRLPWLWKWLFFAVFAAFGCVYLAIAMAPEASPDGSAYHLGLVARYARAHGFMPVTTNFYASMPAGMEMLFLFAFSFGGHSAAAMVHLAFLLALPWLMLGYARRAGFPAAGVMGGLLVFASPVVGLDGASAYVDAGLAAVLFALFYALQIWDAEEDARLLIPVGILAGFGCSIKYTGAFGALYAIGFIAWRMWRTKRWKCRPIAAVAGLTSLFIAPWLVKNWLWAGNPVSPFLATLFPSPYLHPSMVTDWITYLRHYALTSYWQAPWDLTVRGEHLQGLLGPLFLAAPLALLALRHREGRRLLAFAAVLTVPYFGNIGTRFLIPPLPGLALAMGLALAPLGGFAALFVLAHALLSWPTVVPRYASPGAWRIWHVPWKAALRIENEDAYLRRALPGYAFDRLIEQSVPPPERVFALSELPEAYTSRDILVGYECAGNEVLRDMLLAALTPGYQPSVALEFSFPPRILRKVRVVQTANHPAAMWSVTEMRVFHRGIELPRDPRWRLRAAPNPWDVQLAFDNSPVTRWRSWQPAERGMSIEIDFGAPAAVDAVRVEASSDQNGTEEQRLEGMDDSGKWVPLAGRPRVTRVPTRFSLRRAAAEEVMARGIRFLAVNRDNFRAEDFARYAGLWGIRMLGEADGWRLYFIE